MQKFPYAEVQTPRNHSGQIQHTFFKKLENSFWREIAINPEIQWGGEL